ncbi:hypothetical protein MP638_000870 [Amoeboaphelidium occidentale]|nr:hypothetical protein MP638_000870 [Amoeboaphelidium occidentale]
MSSVTKITLVAGAAFSLVGFILWVQFKRKTRSLNDDDLTRDTLITDLCSGLRHCDSFLESFNIGSLPAALQSLAFVFIKEELARAYAVASITPEATPSKLPWKVMNGVLHLPKKVTSCRHPKDIPGYVPINKVVGLIEGEGDSVEYIKFTDCNLLDDDIPYVLEIVKKLPNCKIFDLSWTRFKGMFTLKHAVDESIIEMCKLLDNVVVLLTRFATIDRMDFFTDEHNAAIIDDKLDFSCRSSREANGVMMLGNFDYALYDK